MKRIYSKLKVGSKSTVISTGLIILCVVLLITGIIFLLIEPIKRYNRKKISENAISVIESGITSSETGETDDTEETVIPTITYVVPVKGNEVEGEGYDFVGLTEEYDGEEYYDSYFGIKFSIPEWKGKVYAKGELTNGSYSLTFYEKSNYEWGIVKEWDGMGMLFTVYTSPKEVDGQNIEYPAGSVEINGSVKYLTYFKPTDVRCNTDDENMANDYQRMYKLQRQYFMSGVVDADKNYKPSSNPNAVNLK